MATIWSKERAFNAELAPRVGKYEAIPSNAQEESIKQKHPQLFSFEAVSIGDDNGQMFLVPLDESSKETAEFILKAIKFYIKENN